MNTIPQYIPIDLHCHSTYSDGSYSVREVLDQVKANGGKYIALTDHDTVEGVTEAKIYASELGLVLISGVEISVTWDNNTLVHILGLGIDETNTQLIDKLSNLRALRLKRGEKIAAGLTKIGIHNSLEGALSYCNNPDSLSRTHFARWLTEQGHAKPGKAFDKFLAQGKAGYTNQTWASLEEAMSWIIGSGGIAVIAHPCRYKFTRTKLLKLIADFKSFGGVGIEVVSSSHSKDDVEQISGIALASNLLASVGSDFHTIETYRTIKVGVCHPLPARSKSIFALLGINMNFDSNVSAKISN